MMIASPEDHSHDFIATVGVNAGMNVTLCRDEKIARKKLLKE
jgi:hypothetical protein